MNNFVVGFCLKVHCVVVLKMTILRSTTRLQKNIFGDYLIETGIQQALKICKSSKNDGVLKLATWTRKLNKRYHVNAHNARNTRCMITDN